MPRNTEAEQVTALDIPRLRELAAKAGPITPEDIAAIANIVVSAETARDEAVKRAEAMEKALVVLAEEARQGRVQLERQPHPDEEAPPTSPFYGLANVSQADDCNYHDARAAVDANDLARTALESTKP